MMSFGAMITKIYETFSLSDEISTCEPKKDHEIQTFLVDASQCAPNLTFGKWKMIFSYNKVENFVRQHLFAMPRGTYAQNMGSFRQTMP